MIHDKEHSNVIDYTSVLNIVKGEKIQGIIRIEAKGNTTCGTLTLDSNNGDYTISSNCKSRRQERENDNHTVGFLLCNHEQELKEHCNIDLRDWSDTPYYYWMGWEMFFNHAGFEIVRVL